MAGEADEGDVQAALPLMPAEQLPALPTDEHERRQALKAGNRGQGRPVGVPNKRTAMWAAHILARYQSPLVVMAETYSRPTADLARELGCTLEKAFELQQKAAVELAPYLHGKMPVEVNLNNRGLVSIEFVQGTAAGEAGDLLIAGEILSDQGGSDAS